MRRTFDPNLHELVGRLSLVRVAGNVPRQFSVRPVKGALMQAEDAAADYSGGGALPLVGTDS